MKRILSVLLVLSVLFSFGIIADAAGFDASKLKSSSMYSYDSSSGSWKIVGGYTKSYSNVDVKILLFLCNDYINDGWGPDLRIIYYDKNKANYDAIEGFRATVDDKIYSFYNFEPGEKNSCVYGGPVMRAFLNSLSSAGTITFEIDHITKDGDSYTATIDSVRPGEVTKLVELARLFESSNLWDPAVTKDLYDNDKLYNASIADNPYYDPNAARGSSFDWTELIGYWTSNNGMHTFEMKSNGGYVTTVPVVPRCGDTYTIEDGVIYSYYANNPSKVTPNLKITMISDTEIEIYSYQTNSTYTLHKRR